MQTRLLLLIFLYANLSIGQELQHGLILPSNTESEEICCIYTPKEGFTVYHEPNGNVIGKITRNVPENTGEQAPYQLYFVAADSGKTQLLNTDDLTEISYEIWALSYFERNAGFVRILNEKVSYWLNETALATRGFKVTEWQQFLMNNTGSLLGYYANDPGLNLREAPSVKAKRIRTLKGDLHEIIPTKEYQGLWNKVKVIIRKEHPCNTVLPEAENTIEELEGWIKMIDDSGTPNVWFYARGC